jgi:hypothetical protein
MSFALAFLRQNSIQKAEARSLATGTVKGAGNLVSEANAFFGNIRISSAPVNSESHGANPKLE